MLCARINFHKFWFGLLNPKTFCNVYKLEHAYAYKLNTNGAEACRKLRITTENEVKNVLHVGGTISPAPGNDSPEDLPRPGVTNRNE
ncbi:hypothetical protein CEXT_309771 [Caerostris extrusa]|uniref:Uncharacterized protein n=1 Tax=Caerostris extrusa TaxID=172846 RepID=A0AAV4UGK6_CAEEX|nr:hypothetical protein CEXT_309771 [Caerostris extrusa]